MKLEEIGYRNSQTSRELEQGLHCDVSPSFNPLDILHIDGVTAFIHLILSKIGFKALALNLFPQFAQKCREFFVRCAHDCAGLYDFSVDYNTVIHYGVDSIMRRVAKTACGLLICAGLGFSSCSSSEGRREKAVQAALDGAAVCPRIGTLPKDENIRGATFGREVSVRTVNGGIVWFPASFITGPLSLLTKKEAGNFIRLHAAACGSPSENSSKVMRDLRAPLLHEELKLVRQCVAANRTAECVSEGMRRLYSVAEIELPFPEDTVDKLVEAELRKPEINRPAALVALLLSGKDGYAQRMKAAGLYFTAMYTGVGWEEIDTIDGAKFERWVLANKREDLRDNVLRYLRSAQEADKAAFGQSKAARFLASYDKAIADRENQKKREGDIAVQKKVADEERRKQMALQREREDAERRAEEERVKKQEAEFQRVLTQQIEANPILKASFTIKQMCAEAEEAQYERPSFATRRREEAKNLADRSFPKGVPIQLRGSCAVRHQNAQRLIGGPAQLLFSPCFAGRFVTDRHNSHQSIMERIEPIPANASFDVSMKVSASPNLLSVLCHMHQMPDVLSIEVNVFAVDNIRNSEPE